MNIYVGNIPWSVGNEELRALFEEIGTVQQARLVLDPQTGKSRGFGFVAMPDTEGEKAIERLHGMKLGGRTLRINDADKHPATPKT